MATGGRIGANSKQDLQYFYEDEVFRFDRNGRLRFGLVTETPESHSADEEEDEDFVDNLNHGEVRVAYYPDGKECIQYENELGLIDRALLPGDVIRRMTATGKEQLGYCRDIDMFADIKILGTDNVVRNVLADRLRVIAPWSRDSAVCLDSWVGTTKEVEEKAVMYATNGARVEISSGDFEGFRDRYTHSTREIFNPNIFYPGNVVIGRLPPLERVKNLTPDITLATNKKGRPILSRYTIESVRVHSVWVHWQCKALSDDTSTDEMLKQPNSRIYGEDLKRMSRLNVFESCMLQINDRTFFKYSSTDRIAKYADWEKEQETRFKAILRLEDREDLLKIVQTTSDSSSGVSPVKYMDSMRRRTNGTKSSLSASTAGGSTKSSSKEKWSWSEENIDEGNEEDYAVDIAGIYDNPSPPCSSYCQSSNRVMKRRQVKKKFRNLKRSLSSVFEKREYIPKPDEEVVTEILLVYSTLTIVWQDGSIECGIPSMELYPIHHLDNHEFFPGDFVSSNKVEADSSCRDYGVIQKVDHIGRTTVVKWFTTYISNDDPQPTFINETELSVYDLKDHSDFQYHPGTIVIRVANFVDDDAETTAGQIVDNFTDGRAKVWWTDGHLSLCWPQDLFKVGQYNQSEYIDEESESSWETESENSENEEESDDADIDRNLQIYGAVERARKSIHLLQKMSHLCTDKTDILDEFLMVFKGCRFFDWLLQTSEFKEENFQGLLQRVDINDKTLQKERSRIRIFNDTATTTNAAMTKKPSHAIVSLSTGAVQPLKPTDFAPKVLFNISSPPNKHNSSGGIDGNSSSEEINVPSGIKRKFSFEFVRRDNQRRKFTDMSTNPISLASTSTAGRSSAGLADQPDTNEAKATSSTNQAEKTPETPLQHLKSEYFETFNAAKIGIERIFEKALAAAQANGKHTRESAEKTNSTEEAKPREPFDLQATLDEIHKAVSTSHIQFNKDIAADALCDRFSALLLEHLDKCLIKIRDQCCKKDLPNYLVKTTGKDRDHVFERMVSMFDEFYDSDSDREIKSSPSDAILEKALLDEQPNSIDNVDYIPKQEQPPSDCFEMLSNAPATHRFLINKFQPSCDRFYTRIVRREYKLLQTSLPPGVYVRAFEDRMDLLSVMIEGPKKTPYEDALFFFDIQLGRDYPKIPPTCQYISFCVDRLNPNLYEDGKVCVSLLGTWNGRESEIWGPDSTLLQVIVSIQGLILVSEPYYNEAGYEKQKGTQQGLENSRMYNEMSVIKVVQSTIKQIQHPPTVFRNEILQHFKKNGAEMIKRIRGWYQLSYNALEGKEDASKSEWTPGFPLLPGSRGFCLSLLSALNTLTSLLDKLSKQEAAIEQDAENVN